MSEHYINTVSEKQIKRVSFFVVFFLWGGGGVGVGVGL